MKRYRSCVHQESHRKKKTCHRHESTVSKDSHPRKVGPWHRFLPVQQHLGRDYAHRPE